jgi:hypothetical protein
MKVFGASSFTPKEMAIASDVFLRDIVWAIPK